ncbi:MAG: alpha/beta hydrolase [Thermoanaerobaculia bacterium]
MPFLDSNANPSTEIFYEDTGGSGQPVVLIHGWPLSARMWEAQINALSAAGLRCVSYDRRGFGASGKPPGGYDYDTMTADLRNLIEHLKLRNVVLAGFSMGGGEVARYFGLYGGEHIAKAALISAVPPYLLKSSGNPDGVPKDVLDGILKGVTDDRINFLDGFLQKFFNLDKKKNAISEEVLQYNKFIAWQASPIATQRCVTAFSSTDFRGDLQKIRVPTLVLHGDSDQIVPIEVSGKRSAEMLKGSRLEVIKGAPHGLASTHAEELSRLMLDFIRS